MAAKARPQPPPRSWTYVKFGVLVVAIVLFLGGLILAGRWGLDQLQGKERYRVPFADIECKPPVGMDRGTFLDEVRYINRSPTHLDLLDDQVMFKLSYEFTQHPWVEKVDGVSLIPPKRIVVYLQHRQPVLAVKIDSGLRAVDRFGVLLPTNAPTLGLPVYEGEAKPPTGPAGKRWGDPNVEAAARRLQTP